MKIFLLLLLFGVASSIHINCTFINGGWQVIGTIYYCQVTAMDFTDNSTHITGYNGEHYAGNSSADVKGVWFDCYNYISSNLTTIPKEFSNIFPNLIGLSFVECPINALSGDELDEFPNLQWWQLWGSNVARVPGNFFASTPSMKWISFYFNKFEAVGDGLLENLQNLEEAWFINNICIDQYAYNPSEIPALIEALRQNCPDIEPETTTTSTTTTNQPPKCEIDDLEDFVCGLEQEVEVLQEEVKALKENNARIEILEERNESLEEQVGQLMESNENLRVENEEIRAHLEELERIVLEIYSRPCAYVK